MIRPLFARVVLEREKLKSSLIIPESAQQRNAPAKGIVLAVGPTCEPETEALIGRTVLFGRFAGEWMKDGDKEFYVCQEEDLIGVVNG